jgi:hypothetical protein
MGRWRRHSQTVRGWRWFMWDWMHPLQGRRIHQTLWKLLSNRMIRETQAKQATMAKNPRKATDIVQRREIYLGRKETVWKVQDVPRMREMVISTTFGLLLSICGDVNEMMTKMVMQRDQEKLVVGAP